MSFKDNLTKEELDQFYHLRGEIYRLVNPVEDESNIRLIREKLEKYLPILEKLRDQFEEKEKDYRSGFESYGYGDVDSIVGNFVYISDRWTCAFRTNWLIGLINPHDIRHKGKWSKRGYEHLMGKGSYSTT